MANFGGFVKIHRRVVVHNALKDPGTLGLWVDLICRADWHGGQGQLERGQLLFSARGYAEDHGVSRKWVRHRLEHFIAEGMITTHKTLRGQIITIANYDQWQQDEAKPSRRRRGPMKSKKGPNETQKGAQCGGENLTPLEQLIEDSGQTGAHASPNRGPRNPQIGATDTKRTTTVKNRKNTRTEAERDPDLPLDPDALLYRTVREQIGERAVGLLTKLLRYEEVGDAQNIVAAALRKDDPARYIAGCIHQREKEQPDGNGRSDTRPLNGNRRADRPTVADGIAAILGDDLADDQLGTEAVGHTITYEQH